MFSPRVIWAAWALLICLYGLLMMLGWPVMVYAKAIIKGCNVIQIARRDRTAAYLLAKRNDTGQWVAENGLKFVPSPLAVYNHYGTPTIYVNEGYSAGIPLNYVQTITRLRAMGIKDYDTAEDVYRILEAKDDDLEPAEKKFKETFAKTYGTTDLTVAITGATAIRYDDVRDWIDTVGPGMIAESESLDRAILRDELDQPLLTPGLAGFLVTVLLFGAIAYVMINNSEAGQFDAGYQKCEQHYAELKIVPKAPSTTTAGGGGEAPRPTPRPAK